MISRRHLLQFGGLTALGAGWPGGALRALAQSPAQTRRLIVISHCHGWPYATWCMRPEDASETEPWALDLESLDQLVAARLARPDRLPSLELSVDSALESGRPIAYNDSGVRLPAENTPLRAWERVFGPASSGDEVGAYRRSTLDFAYQEYRAVAPRFDAFVDIIAAAFSCDITRVVSFSLGEMPTAEFGADHISDKVHKGIAHYIHDDAAKHAAMTDYLVFHAQQVARLVSTLEAIPDAGGGSLMDNTLIVWGSELGDGWHGYRYYCPVLIGGSWAFNTGRYMYWPHETPAQMRVPHAAHAGRHNEPRGHPPPATPRQRRPRHGPRHRPRRPQPHLRPARRLHRPHRPAGRAACVAASSCTRQVTDGRAAT